MSAARRAIRGAATVLAAAALVGCATFSEDGGFEAVETETHAALGREARWLDDDDARAAANAEVTRLIESELSADSAMQVALLANPRLQAEYANLGIAEADLVQAGRVPNPGFSFGRTSGGGTQEIERGLHFSLLAVLTLPTRVGIEQRRFETAKLAAAGATVETALDARAAWFDAVAARQSLAYFREVAESADASRALMSRMARVGNSSRLDLAREQLFHAESVAALARAAQSERAAREALLRAMGLWGEQTAIRLPDRLPELPAAAEAIVDVERTALARRLDVRGARQALDGLAASLGLTRATRFVNVLEAGPTQVRDRGEPVRDGYEISLEIPIFDPGDAKIAGAERRWQQATERLRAMAIDARSEVREAYLEYRTSYDIARHYRDEIVPLRKRISDEQLLRYNGMLIGVFDLIADAREQVATISAYLDALRAFWSADTRLKAAMLVGLRPVSSGDAAAMPRRRSGDTH